MEKEVKELQSEDVRYKARMAGGAWLDGQSLKENSKATMPKANLDHGNFESSAVRKDNA